MSTPNESIQDFWPVFLAMTVITEDVPIPIYFTKKSLRLVSEGTVFMFFQKILLVGEQAYLTLNLVYNKAKTQDTQLLPAIKSMY